MEEKEAREKGSSFYAAPVKAGEGSMGQHSMQLGWSREGRGREGDYAASVVRRKGEGRKASMQFRGRRWGGEGKGMKEYSMRGSCHFEGSHISVYAPVARSAAGYR